MATITTILGTDSVSSSRIVINNNFDALNTELGTIGGLLNTTTQQLTLTGEIKGGTLKVFNGSINVLDVTTSDITANVETIFNEKATFNAGIVENMETGVTALPTTGWESSSYVLDATVLTGTLLLPAAEDGQRITLIADGGTITLDFSNITGVTANVVINDAGVVTLTYSTTNSEFYVVSAMNSTVTY